MGSQRKDTTRSQPKEQTKLLVQAPTEPKPANFTSNLIEETTPSQTQEDLFNMNLDNNKGQNNDTPTTMASSSTNVISGFASDSEDDNGWIQINRKNKGKAKETEESLKKNNQFTTETKGRTSLPPPVNWSEEYGRQCYKMQIPLANIPRDTTQGKINNLSQILFRLESFKGIYTTI